MMRLSRALCRPPKHLYQATTKAERLKHFLLDHWAERKDGLPELVFLTPIDAAEVCTQQLGFYVDDSTIVKLRQRLRLKPCRRKLYRLKPSGGGFAVVKVDKT
jgi:hypothetical protein